MNIYVTGPVGTSGALKQYEAHKAEMERRFPRFFRARIEAMKEDLPETGLCDRNNKEQITLAKSGDCIYICTMTEGGLFGALWRGCEELKCGCEVFLDAIPIRQETVEITELTGDNPYETESVGNLLLISGADADALKKDPALSGQVRELHLIGRTTTDRDRVVLSHGTRRFLTPPLRQQKDTANRKSTVGSKLI